MEVNRPYKQRTFVPVQPVTNTPRTRNEKKKAKKEIPPEEEIFKVMMEKAENE